MRDKWHGSWVTKAVRAPGCSGRIGFHPGQNPSPRLKIADNRLTAGNEIIREHVPRPDLERAPPYSRRQCIRALRTHPQVVNHCDGLPIQEKRIRQLWRQGEESVNQRSKALSRFS
jgi:hypothetical protein